VDAVLRAERGGPRQTLDGRAGADRAGAHDQGVVRQFLGSALRGVHRQPLAGHVDPGGEGVGADLHARGLEVGEGAVGKVAPVPDLAGHVVRDAADGEVRVAVGHDDGDLAVGIQLAGAQGGADAGVAAADGDDALAGHRDLRMGEGAGAVGVLRAPPPVSRRQARWSASSRSRAALGLAPTMVCTTSPLL
jgi:hypothetical protein